MKRTIFCFLVLTSLSCGQGVPGGTINGKAIPSALLSSPQICGNLRDVIRTAACDQASHDMNLTVTPEDIAAAKKAIKMQDPVAESRFLIEKETMMVNALTAVDKGQNPDQVYKDNATTQRCNARSLGVLPEAVEGLQGAQDYPNPSDLDTGSLGQS